MSTDDQPNNKTFANNNALQRKPLSREEQLQEVLKTYHALTREEAQEMIELYGF